MSDKLGAAVSVLHLLSGCYAEVHISWESFRASLRTSPACNSSKARVRLSATIFCWAFNSGCIVVIISSIFQLLTIFTSLLSSRTLQPPFNSHSTTIQGVLPDLLAKTHSLLSNSFLLDLRSSLLHPALLPQGEYFFYCFTCILNVPQKVQKMQKILFSDDSRYHDCFVASNKGLFFLDELLRASS